MVPIKSRWPDDFFSERKSYSFSSQILSYDYLIRRYSSMPFSMQFPFDKDLCISDSQHSAGQIANAQ